MIPEFDDEGLLPIGIYPCTIEELKQRFGYNYRRQILIEGLVKGVEILKRYGSLLIYLDGSFVTNKESPGDFDACWSYEDITEEILISLITDYPIFSELAPPRLNQKNEFKGEFFPAFFMEGGSGKTFLDFFQIDKESGLPKGIIQLL